MSERWIYFMPKSWRGRPGIDHGFRTIVVRVSCLFSWNPGLLALVFFETEAWRPVVAMLNDMPSNVGHGRARTSRQLDFVNH